MPMIVVQVGCGCKVVEHYPERLPWAELPKKQREDIITRAHARHVHRPPKTPAHAAAAEGEVE
jgi:predicted Fe-S protein YdhL (DUF1289 family)